MKQQCEDEKMIQKELKEFYNDDTMQEEQKAEPNRTCMGQGKREDIPHK